MGKKSGDNFWRGKRVLITGYEGFLGSHLTRNLLNYHAEIWGLDIRTYRKQTILSPEELKRVNIIKGSVEKISLVSQIIKENKINFIFHLAAKSLVNECLTKPVRGFATNIKGTWNVLEAVRNNKEVEGVIIASSDKAYGSCRNLPYSEDTPLQGNHPYDVSKSCADLIAYTYYHTFGVPVAITRCGNIYGPGDFNFSRIVPDAIRCALTERTLLIRSDGKFVRDYVYVDDIVNGYILLAEKVQRLKLSGEAFNFSNGSPVSVLELVKKIYKIAGKKMNYKILGTAKYEIRNQYLSAEKAEKLLEWRSKYSLEEGLKKTIGWYKENGKTF